MDLKQFYVYIINTFIHLTLKIGLSSEVVTIGFDKDQEIQSTYSKYEQEFSKAKYVMNSTGYSFLPEHFIFGIDTHDTIKKLCRSMNNGTSIFVLYPGNCEQEAITSSMLAKLSQTNIRMAPSSMCCHLQQGFPYRVNYGSSLCDISHLIEELVSVQRWSRLVIFYVKSKSMIIDNLMDKLGRMNVSVSLYGMSETPSKTEVKESLTSTMLPAGYAYPYLVFGNLIFSEAILNESLNMNLRTLDNNWIFFGEQLSGEEIKQRLIDYDNILVISKSSDVYLGEDKQIQEIVGVLSDTYESVLHSAGLIQSNQSQNLCHTRFTAPTCKALWNETQSNVAGVEPSHNQSQFRVQSSFIGHDGVPRLIDVGRWTGDDKLEHRNEMFLNSFNGFNNRTFKITTLEYSFFQKKKDTGNGTFRWEGLTFDILDELAMSLNFSYEVIEPPDGQWGIEVNGTWNGMIGDVMDKEVDFAAACFSMTATRQMVVDFASPYFHDQSVVIIKRPQGSSKVLLFLKPFRWEVWLCIVTAVVGSAGVLWLVTHASPYYKQNDMSKPWNDGGLTSPKNTLLYMYGLSLQQGGIWLPESHSGRVVVGCCWFFAIVVAATYTGNLIAFLAVSTVDMPFKTLEGMANQNSYKFGSTEGVALVMLFRGSSFETYQKIWDKMKQPGWMVPSYTAGYERAKAESYAFIAEKSWFKQKSATDCGLTMVQEEFYPTSYAWAFPKGYPHLKRFSTQINKMRESGLLQNWIKKWTPKNLHCKGLGPITQAKVVELNDCQGGFYVLSFGLWCGCIVFLCEQLYSRILSKRKIFSIPSKNTLIKNNTPVSIS